MAFVKRFVRSQKGQDLAEYAISLSVIGTLVTAVSVVIAGNVNDLWDAANTIIATAAS
jgi:Flp pilus assembly pilin Flp